MQRLCAGDVQECEWIPSVLAVRAGNILNHDCGNGGGNMCQVPCEYLLPVW